MKLASDEGVPKSDLQMLHVYVFLVAPLGACHMAESREALIKAPVKRKCNGNWRQESNIGPY